MQPVNQFFMRVNSNFANNGLLVGAIFIASEYIIYTLAFWKLDMPYPKLSLYITFLFCIAMSIILYQRKGFVEMLFSHKISTLTLPKDILWCFLLYLTSMGSFILLNLIKANIYNQPEIIEFINHNEYVIEALNPYSLLNCFLYPVFMVFVYQGFLLNGLSKYMGFAKANWIVALFYGYWFGDIIGFTIICLFLNLIYIQSKNILYPILVLIIVNVIFSGLYTITKDNWILKASEMNYNEELLTGIVFTVLLIIASIPVVLKAINKKE